MNKLLVKQTKEFLDSEEQLSALCNIAAAIKLQVEDINWVGFYLYKNDKLILGPFQGKPACAQIDIGKGVCGTSFQRRTLFNVSDVSKFEGHIVCDADSKSELVIPLMHKNEIYGVLDIDSASLNRFGANEEDTFEKIAILIGKSLANNH